MRKILLIIGIFLILLIYIVSAYTSIPKIGPSDNISEDQIHILKDKIVIDVKNAKWSRYADTGSMMPFINENCNGIEIIPHSEDQIKIGDIVSYENKDGELIVHQVIEISKDQSGTYYILKGFANLSKDSEKVRFDQIRYKTVGVIF